MKEKRARKIVYRRYDYIYYRIWNEQQRGYAVYRRRINGPGYWESVPY